MADWDITTAAARLQVLAIGAQNSEMWAIDTNNFFNTYYTSSGYVDVLSVSTSTWGVSTTQAAPDQVYSLNATPWSVQVDSTHYMTFYCGGSNDGFAIMYEVADLAISTCGSAFEYDTSNGQLPFGVKIDATHVLALYKETSSVGAAIVLAVNTSTWAITTAGAQLNYVSGTYENRVSGYLVNANHVLVAYKGVSGGSAAQFAEVLEINTSTWAVTTKAAALNVEDANTAPYGTLVSIDSNHAMIVWATAAGKANAQILTINTTTWAVTTAAAALEFDASNFANTEHGNTRKLDANHVLVFHAGAANDGYLNVLTVNTSTWGITTATAALEIDTQYCAWPQISPTIAGTNDNKYMVTWQGATGQTFAQVVNVAIPAGATAPTGVKTINDTAIASVKTINDTAIASVKTILG